MRLTAQRLSLINYSIREGLPSSEVYEVFQDSKGFIWFATDRGVVRFDGTDMKVFTVKDGLTDPVVFGFNEAEQNRIWFRTYSGKVSFFEDGKIHSTPLNRQLEELVQSNLLYCFYSCQDKIYFSTERYIGTISQDGKILKEEIGGRELWVKTLPEKKITYGFYGLSTRINKLVINGKHHSISLTDTINHNKVICGLMDETRLFITINSDIFEYSNNMLKKIFTGRAPIISLSKDQEGFYWVGYSNHGTDRLRNNFIFESSPAILSELSITKALQDHEGGFWFSSLESGVYYASDLEAVTIDLVEKTRVATFNNTYVTLRSSTSC